MGYVYLLTNRHMPGLVKIGMTTNDPITRVAQLSHSSGVPGRFTLNAYVEVEDPRATEALLHTIFDDTRAERGEFFHVSPKAVIAALRTVGSVIVEVEEAEDKPRPTLLERLGLALKYVKGRCTNYHYVPAAAAFVLMISIVQMANALRSATTKSNFSWPMSVVFDPFVNMSTAQFHAVFGAAVIAPITVWLWLPNRWSEEIRCRRGWRYRICALTFVMGAVFVALPLPTLFGSLVARIEQNENSAQRLSE